MSYTPLSVGTPVAPGRSKWDDHNTQDIVAGQNVGDALAQIVAQDQCILFPPAVNFAEDVGAAQPLIASFDTFVFPYWYLINEDLSSAITPISWKESGSALGSYELPFRNLVLGFELKQLVTAVNAEDRGAVDNYSTTSTASATYGSRTQVLNNQVADSGVGVSFSKQEVDTDNVVINNNKYYNREFADRTIEWFDRTVFSPQSWEISGGMIFNEVTDTSSVTKILQTPYLYQGGLFRLMTMNATGAGGVNLDFVTTAMRMTLSIGKTDWVMRFGDALPASTAFHFILDDTDLGVLDEDRI